MNEQEQFNVYFLSASGLFLALFFIATVLILLKFKRMMIRRDAYYEKIIGQNKNTEVLSMITEVKDAIKIGRAHV